MKIGYAVNVRRNVILYIGLSPSGKAQDFDSCIRWFESSQPCSWLSVPHRSNRQDVENHRCTQMVWYKAAECVG